MATIVLYGIVVWRGTRAALRASETFGTYLGARADGDARVPGAVNMSVAMGMLPTKGLTLPLHLLWRLLAGHLDGRRGRAPLAERLRPRRLRNPGPSRVRRMQEAAA